MPRRAIRPWIAGAAATALALAPLAANPALARGRAPSAAKPAAYTFGVAMPMTGSQASYGADQVQALMWAVQFINSHGGVDGVPLKPIVEDTQADPQLGINDVNKLISLYHVPAFITAWSSVVAAVAPIANRHHVLELSIGANDPSIAHLGPYVWTTYPLANVDITALAKYVYTNLHDRTAAVLYIDNATGIYGAQVFRNVFQQMGGKVVAFEAYPQNTTSYTAQLLKVKAANPQVLHIQGLVQDTLAVIAQARELGITSQITSYSAADNPQLLKQDGAAANGLIVTALAPSQGPQLRHYLALWQSRAHRLPNGLPYTEYLYDAPFILKAQILWLIQHHLAYTGPNLLKAMQANPRVVTPLTGLTVFNPNHTVDKPVYLLKAVHGQFVQIAKLPG
ncbi:MAG: ABC transporter substrate-binding protein [Firmicutes bacterium]|nr:ABC transporter substrate-binding protein [Bacillota bacterium]